MRDVRFAFEKPDGTVAVVQLGRACLPEGLADAECIALAVARMKEAGTMPSDAEPVEIQKANIPTTRTHREAWRLSGKQILVDATKKSEIDARPKPLTLEQRIAALERR